VLQDAPFQIRASPWLRSIAAQKVFDAHDTEPNPAPGSIVCAADHSAPFQVNTSPALSVTRQKLAETQETESAVTASTDWGVDQLLPFQVVMSPSASTAAQKSDDGQDREDPPLGSMRVGADHTRGIVALGEGTDEGDEVGCGADVGLLVALGEGFGVEVGLLVALGDGHSFIGPQETPQGPAAALIPKK
jgi:hypothetical protein